MAGREHDFLEDPSHENLKALLSIIPLTAKLSPQRNERISEKGADWGGKGKGEPTVGHNSSYSIKFI